MKSMLRVSLRASVALIATALCSTAFSQPVTAVLRLNEKVPLENLASYAKSRVSPLVSRYSAKDIRAISAPEENDYQGLLSNLREKGFQVVNESATHLWITITGDSSTFENVFRTRIAFLENGRHQNDGRVQIPQDLDLIASVSGLDSTRVSRPHYTKHSVTDKAAMGGIAPDTIKQVYGFAPIYASGVNGTGQHIAIATYDGFKEADVKSFYSKLKLSPAPTVDTVAFNGTAAYDENSAGETELDAEFSGMMAPGANIHVFASATNDDAGELQIFTAILDDGRAQVINYSWGGCEKSVTPAHQAEMDKVFARAVAQGVNIFVATGDSGSDSCQDGSVAADWPAANPNVVAVGGTSLKVSGAKSVETAWTGSGGGISGAFDLPSWQSKLGSSFQKRSYPDVSFNADPNTGQAAWISSWGSAGWQVIGGTSMAAPQWTGFMTLVNAARAKQGKTALGFIDPIIYGMSDKDQALAFNDVTSGSNGGYTATKGWDAVTGLGSMHADVLLQYLLK